VAASIVKTLLFKRARWTIPKARQWATDHEYLADDVETSADWIRIVQVPNVPGARYRYHWFSRPRGIKALLMFVPGLDGALGKGE